MRGETKERWKELCKRASVEQDPERFVATIQELLQALEDREERRRNVRVALSGALDGRQVCVEPYAYDIATPCPHSACLFVQRFRRCSSIAERIEQRADIRCAATDPIANRSLRHRQDWLSLDRRIASRRLRSQTPSRADGLLLVSDGEVRRRKRTVLPRRGSDGRPS